MQIGGKYCYLFFQLENINSMVSNILSFFLLHKWSFSALIGHFLQFHCLKSNCGTFHHGKDGI